MKKLNLKELFHSTVFIINIVAIILLFSSAFSDRISPESNIIFPFLGLVFPFILVINIGFCIWWLIIWKWKRALMCLFCFIICWGAIRTYFPLNINTKNIPSNCIKILTYNVMQFEHEKPNSEKDPNLVLKYIADSKADIVCIQEFGTFKSKGLLTETEVKKVLKDYPYSYIHKLKWSIKDQLFGLAVFSKFPISKAHGIPFDSNYNGSFICELDINGKNVTLVNNHLESNKLSMEERYEYYDFLKDFDSHKLDMITGKMTKRLTPAFRKRASQADIVSDFIKKVNSPYIIVCGDFNDTPISYSRRKIKGDLCDSFVESGSGIGITYNRFRFFFRIDYIMHSKNIKSYNCTVGKIKNSDHYPVYTYLQLN